MALLENGHSPDIFSSFSFVQNIFVGPNFPASYSLSDVPRLSGCCLCGKFHHLLRSRRNAQQSQRRDDSTDQHLNPEPAYNIHSKRVRSQDVRKPLVAKPMSGWRKKAAGQSVTKWGWCGPAAYQRPEIISRRLLACNALFI